MISEIIRDLRNISRDPAVKAVVYPTGLHPYKPGGLYFDNAERPDDASPLFWLPPPYHPIEVLAAFRGAWGRMRVPADVIPVGEFRAQRFVNWTAAIGEVLYITPEQCTLLYHMFTRLNTNCGPDVSSHAVKLYEAAGVSYRAPDSDGPFRLDFWGLVRQTYEEIL